MMLIFGIVLGVAGTLITLMAVAVWQEESKKARQDGSPDRADNK